MKVKNLNPYFGAACERYVVRGCGDESHLFGMLSPRAWEEAQKTCRRNQSDLPNGWIDEQLSPVLPVMMPPDEAPGIVPAVVGFIAGVIVGVVIGLVYCKQPVPAAATAQPTTLYIDGQPPVVRDGPLIVVDTASGQSFSVPAGSSLALPALD